MGGVLQPWLVVFLALTCGGGPVSPLTQYCPPDIVLNHEDKQLIKEDDYEGNHTFLNVYLKPQQGFQGLFINVTGVDGTLYGAWFAAEPQCFKLSDKWQQLVPRARIETNILELEFGIGDCLKKCMRNYSQDIFRNLSMVAYGPSSWLLKWHSGCDTKYRNTSSNLVTLNTCDNIPRQAPSTIFTTPTIITTTPPFETMTNASETSSFSAWPTWKLPTITAAAAAVVVVAAAVVVVYLRRKSATPTTGEPATQATEPAMELHTIENELYEPYDKYAATVTTPRHQEPLHVMDNDLYQPFTG